MSCCNSSRTYSAAGGSSPASGRCCGSWKPLDIAIVVFAFILFWPLGLALLMFKFWSRAHGREGDIVGFAREQAARFNQGWSFESGETKSEGWRGPSFMHSSGNAAFDEWREGELARLEEERRKLAEAERDFADHIDQLRRAKDKDEFDSFMRARKGPAA